MDFANTINILKSGLGDAYPCVAYAIGCKDKILKSDIMGDRQTYPEREPADRNTLFDMASLSKVISTTMVAFHYIQTGELLLCDTIGRFLPEAVGTERENINIFQLMTHSSGITPYLDLKTCKCPRDAVKLIIDSKPFCKPGEQVYYSCMGYILLQNILETIGGEPLDVLAQKYSFDPLGMTHTCYRPTGDNIATEEYSAEEGKYIKGRVHDGAANYIGGVSGNAGVFSTLDDMCRFAKMIACEGKIDGVEYINHRFFEKAITNYTQGLNENRGLGFQLTDTISSLTGDMLSQYSYGHTGFTGTALYVDRETKFWGLLLTNAVHYGRDNKPKYFRIRRQFYNSAFDEFIRNYDGGKSENKA